MAVVLAQASNAEVLQRIRDGKLIETVDQMSPAYLEGMIRILTVSADTELISAPAYYNAAKHAPTLNAFGSATAIIQDELGHAHIAYRLMRDLGVDTEELIYSREPNKFKYPYAFDIPLGSWIELVVANAFYDRAGFCLLGDIFRTTTFGPWKRALVKVDKEETFHLRHGENWMRKIAQTAEGREQLQTAVNWMFILTLEWFGLPDDLKRHSEQLDFGFKGQSNDQLRQTWMSTAVPLATELGLHVPAHLDESLGAYVIDCPFPAQFDEENKRWLLEDGPISWEQVVMRWKKRGPMNDQYIETIQRGKRGLERLISQS